MCVCVFVRPHLGGHFHTLNQTCEDVFSCEDFLWVLGKCMCICVSPCNSTKTCMHACVACAVAAKSRMDEAVYRRARHVISENQRCLDAAAALKSADYVTFGQLMTASHHSLRSLN